MSSVFQYHLAIFLKPASRACFTGIYLSSLQRVVHSDWSHLRRGKTLWQVGVICTESPPWVSARIYQYNLSTAELKILSSFIPWGSLKQDLLFSIQRETTCNSAISSHLAGVEGLCYHQQACKTCQYPQNICQYCHRRTVREEKTLFISWEQFENSH